MKTRKWLGLLPLMLVVLAVGCWGQDSDDDDPGDSGDFQTGASLWMTLDQAGKADVNVTLPKIPQSWDPLRAALAQVLRCPADRLKNPEPARNLPELPAKWSQSQRDRYVKQVSEYNQRILGGECEGVMARSATMRSGDMDFSPFLAELGHNGIEELNVTITFPDSEYREYSHANVVREPRKSGPMRNYLSYTIPVTATAQAAVVHLAYGFRPMDVNRALMILVAFIFVPLLATLWLRHGAMVSGKVDAAAAWFGFFRTFNVLVTGSMLLWITSSFGARALLKKWIATLALPLWQQVTADVLILVGPAFLLYFLCTAVSYPVHAQLRGSQWTWREFMVQQFVTVGAQGVPLMLALAAFEVMRQEIEVSVALLVLAFAMFQAFLFMKLHVLKSFPQPLETGELRDRVFELARRLGVGVKQIFVLPAGKGQMANAFAAKNQIVMFTDYLLQQLSKREVDGVAAHELAHLQHKHPGKRGAAFAVAVLLPAFYTWMAGILTGLIAIPLNFLPPGLRGQAMRWLLTGTAWFTDWSQRDFVLMMLGLTFFYALSRHFENVADAAAVRLTGDPEAQITGLLKISRLSRMPIHWGKASESWLTHPSTMRRTQRMAAAGGLAPERLQQILDQYAAESRQGPATTEVAAEHYEIPVAKDPDAIRTAVGRHMTQKIKLWALYGVYVVPLALCSWLVRWLGLEGNANSLAYFGGIVVTGLMVMLAGVWLGQAGYGKERQRLRARFERDHVAAGREGDVLVGFAPGEYPRLYGSHYHWDMGYLVFAKDRLQFVGEKTKFALAPGQIDGIVLGRGGPSWWKFERIYVRWNDGSASRSGIFNLYLLEPGSMWTVRRRVRELCRQLQAWQAQAQSYPAARPELAELQSPDLKPVTCFSPKMLGTLKINVRILTYLLLLAAGVGVVFHSETGYLCSAVILLRIVMQIPYWRYRDTPPALAPAPGPEGYKAQAAANGSVQ